MTYDMQWWGQWGTTQIARSSIYLMGFNGSCGQAQSGAKAHEQFPVRGDQVASRRTDLCWADTSSSMVETNSCRGVAGLAVLGCATEFCMLRAVSFSDSTCNGRLTTFVSTSTATCFAHNLIQGILNNLICVDSTHVTIDRLYSYI